MPYATQADLEANFGTDEVLIVADRNKDGVIDAAVVAAALTAATDEMNGYIQVAYTLPLPSVPGSLKDICCTLAMYNLSGTGSQMTDDKRTRREDAIKTLVRISEGKFDLGFNKNPNGVRGAVVVTGTRPRIFSREAMKNI